MILLFGAPPPHPGNVSLTDFGTFIADLAQWTNNCRRQYMEWEGIHDEKNWGSTYNRCKREAFDVEFINWSYTLKPEEYDERPMEES